MSYGTGYVSSQTVRCRFGATDAMATVKTSSLLACVTPALSPGLIVLEITGNSLEYETEQSIVVESREVAFLKQLIPASGSQNGKTTVSIFGYNFYLSGSGIFCRFGDEKDSPGLYVSSTLVLCQAPPVLLPGAVPLQLSMNSVDFTSKSLLFRYEPVLHIFRLLPSIGSYSERSLITIFGVDFPNVPDLQCMVQNPNVQLRADWTVWLSSTSLSCDIGALKTGHYSVGVTSNGVDFVFSKDIFSSLLPPSISSLSPSIGSCSGGSVVVLSGSYFQNSSKLQCNFDGMLMDATFSSTSEVLCLTPPHVEGTILMSLVENGLYFSNTQQLFQYTNSVYLISLLPSFGSEYGGSSVSLIGINFICQNQSSSSIYHCVFGVISTLSTVITSSVIICISPAQKEGAVHFSLSINSAEYISSSFSYIYTRIPDFLIFNPSAGPLEGGTMITITGAHFFGSSRSVCKQGRNTLFLNVLTSSLAKCISGRYSMEEIVDLHVAFNGAEFYKLSGGFKYSETVHIVSLWACRWRHFGRNIF